MPQYYTLPTAIGEAKIANAIALGGTITISELAVGDGGGSLPVPDSDRENLVNEVRRAPINTSDTDPDNPNWIVVEQVLPPDVGGWTIREIGLFDSDGDLIAYGNYPETYKPVLSEGSGRTQTIRFVMQVSDTAAVTLKVDPSVVLATRKYADDSIAAHEQSRNHPAATTTALGFVEKATLTEAKNGTPDKFPDAASMKAAIADSRSGDQFATYDASRIYNTGEITRGSDGRFYEFYDRDQAGTVQGVDPTNAANRPHVWMEWHGVLPGTVIEWRSETLPEGYIENDGAVVGRTDYRRIFAVYGTTHGAGDGATTFNLPDDRGEFKRGWDHGRGIDTDRVAFADHQWHAVERHVHSLPTGMSNTGTGHWGVDDQYWKRTTATSSINDGPVLGEYVGTYHDDNNNGSPTGTNWIGGNYSAETRPRNNAVIYLTKI
ncbi:hypothetical protein L861_08945 [Litchfieldella anticariensis FP35 = DSM 16096]|uniref:Uncharacterized protein n=1 Tax=Litchfieldella anticariensis (strain DSM 16096 / CECT 5854 / CIP 108499 / LMG 22089 / FP35) TaxID=1121939 RepID=S2KK31_LITA3|nr:phage tail protein [Halomonas anticariensis]EPC02477.1 hypothetical protein L861_08945 [Halomonas anticariensis FP35 = DSM 16096]